MPHTPGFKPCQTCHSDGHSSCLLCLGDSYNLFNARFIWVSRADLMSQAALVPVTPLSMALENKSLKKRKHTSPGKEMKKSSGSPHKTQGRFHQIRRSLYRDRSWYCTILLSWVPFIKRNLGNLSNITGTVTMIFPSLIPPPQLDYWDSGVHCRNQFYSIPKKKTLASTGGLSASDSCR